MILTHAKEHHSTTEAVILRAGFVLAKEQNIGDMIKGMAPSVKVDVLARALISSALDDSKTRLVENPEIKQLGA